MRNESSLTRRHSLPYRTAYEIYAASVWLFASAYMAYLHAQHVMPREISALLYMVCIVFAVKRGHEGWLILRDRSLLSGRRFELMPRSKLQTLMRPDHLWLGYGFVWEPKHTQKLHELSRINPASLMLPDFMHRFFGRGDQYQKNEEIGMPYIHGLEPNEIELHRFLKNFEGGTLILGTTQAGKGVALCNLFSQAVLRNDVVIFIDPKGSPRVYESFRRACTAAGRGEPLNYHPGNRDKTKGIRLDPLATFSTGAQIATRIMSVIPGKPDAFTQFAWSCIKTFADALIELKIKPSLKLLSKHINHGIDDLLRDLLLDRIEHLASENWREEARSFMAPIKEGRLTESQEELLLMVSFYEHVLDKKQQTLVVDECLKVFHHSKEHYAKITASLMPIFAMLTSGPLGDSFSPDPKDAADSRPIWNLESIILTRSCLYCHLDSLSDNMIASAVGSILLGDLVSVAGKRYNLGKTDIRISLFVDEASNVCNNPLIEILNKGAEGGIYTTVAMQTIADLAHRLGSQDAARMVLGNCNNLIALRCKDRPTQDFVTETFGKTYIHQVDTTLSTHADTHAGLPSFEGGASHKRTAVREEIIPSEYLGKLPNGQFFAFVGGGHLLKGRVPVITD